ncbi:uncharacterized protein LAESUDRAFT_786126 [Laetiporus sulphureus 93-53]|uniref:Uncharacterized protein n=1 Tax=Laetiporus sulphureus 93-53 TaxID=1314785 RepID=A0A165D613_9APHY|nr:uncharacterized protein LAESUDRAFT_786126 [Laetiporus sulphureus 93-53]KZT04216.1 hypothetical protein LAESUDRAFT_786126 [Laetiporus sulphureus 93-53]
MTMHIRFMSDKERPAKFMTARKGARRGRKRRRSRHTTPGCPAWARAGRSTPLFEEEDDNEDAEDIFHSQHSHTRNPSSMSLLVSPPPPSATPSLRRAGQSERPNPDLTFFQRMKKYGRGLLKRPEYRAGRVCLRAPDTPLCECCAIGGGSYEMVIGVIKHGWRAFGHRTSGFLPLAATVLIDREEDGGALRQCESDIPIHVRYDADVDTCSSRRTSVSRVH